MVDHEQPQIHLESQRCIWKQEMHPMNQKGVAGMKPRDISGYRLICGWGDKKVKVTCQKFTNKLAGESGLEISNYIKFNQSKQYLHSTAHLFLESVSIEKQRSSL